LWSTGSNTRDGVEKFLASDGQIACHFLHLPKGFYFKDISKPSQRMATTYRLLIGIEHALPNWPLVDFRKK